MVAQTVTGTRTRILEIPTTVLIVVILVPPLKRLPLGVVSTAQIEWSSFPMISRRNSRQAAWSWSSQTNASLVMFHVFCARSHYRYVLRNLTKKIRSDGTAHVRLDDGIVSQRLFTCPLRLAWLSPNSIELVRKLF